MSAVDPGDGWELVTDPDDFLKPGDEWRATSKLAWCGVPDSFFGTSRRTLMSSFQIRRRKSIDPVWEMVSDTEAVIEANWQWRVPPTYAETQWHSMDDVDMSIGKKIHLYAHLQWRRPKQAAKAPQTVDANEAERRKLAAFFFPGVKFEWRKQ